MVAVLVLALSGCERSGDRKREAPGARTPNPPASSATATQAPGSAQPSLPSSAPLAPAHVARTVTVLGSGDVLIHPPLWQQAAADASAQGRSGYDFGPIYAGVRADHPGR